MPEVMMVRLKPYDPKQGQVMRDFTAPWRTKFKAGVWYQVDAAAAAYLKTIKQSYEDPYSPPAFDVVSRKEAEDLVAQEEQEELGRVVPEESIGAPIAPLKATVKADAALNRPKPKHELSAGASALPAGKVERMRTQKAKAAPKKKTSRKKSSRKPRSRG